MCDDLGPDDFFEDDFEEYEPDDGAAAADEREPTPAERLFYSLGQLYRLYRHGALNVRPIDFDVWDLAGIIGVRGDIEPAHSGPRRLSRRPLRPCPTGAPPHPR